MVCTQGGECLAGLKAAVKEGLVKPGQEAVLDSTAHMLKFIDFQNMYYENAYPSEFEVEPKPELINRPRLISPPDIEIPAPGKPLEGEAMDTFVARAAKLVAQDLGLE